MFRCDNCQVVQPHHVRPKLVTFYRKQTRNKHRKDGTVVRDYLGNPETITLQLIDKELRCCAFCHEGHGKGIPLELLAKQARQSAIAAGAKDRLLQRAASKDKPKEQDIRFVPIVPPKLMGAVVEVDKLAPLSKPNRNRRCITDVEAAEALLEARPDGGKGRSYPAKGKKHSRNKEHTEQPGVQQTVERGGKRTSPPVRHKAKAPQRKQPRHKCG